MPSTSNRAAARASSVPLWSRWLLALVAAALTVAPMAHRRTVIGDLSNYFTDHMRHEAESLALLKHGFEIYRRPYRQMVQGLGLDPIHEGLWPDQTAPYPPLGILFFAPEALMEQGGLISPAHAHSACVEALVLVALLACLAGWAVARRSNRPFQVAFLVIACALLYGSGANGFFDVLFCLFGFLGLACVAEGKDARALVFLALAGAFHFRALVFAPPAVFAAWRGLHGRERTRVAWVLAASAVFLAPVAYAAAILDTHAFQMANPLRLSHARALAFVALGIAGAALLAWRRLPIAASSLAIGCVLMFADPGHCWWHALVLVVPPMVAAAEEAGRSAPLVAPYAWVWTLLAALVAFRDPWPPFWEWLRWCFLRRP